jgi:hypothetical protein
MNYLVLSKIYKIIDKHDGEACETGSSKKISFTNYEELTNYLKKHDYDYEFKEFLIDVVYKQNKEEALITESGESEDSENKIILTTDNTSVRYSDVKFVINNFCKNKADIDVIGYKKYCEFCFNKENQITVEQTKKILATKNETHGLSTSEKIKYILAKSPTELTGGEIYKLGEPWDLKTFTPKNSVLARISTLHKNKQISCKAGRYCLM